MIVEIQLNSGNKYKDDGTAGVRSGMEGWGGPREARKAIQDSRKNYLARREARLTQEDTTLQES